MIHIPENGILYHGSYTKVVQVDLSLCRSGLDFGKGFYLTSSLEQAISYIPAAVRKAKRRGILPDSFKEADGKVPVHPLFRRCRRRIASLRSVQQKPGSIS